ncbi:MAG: hypothetical protein A4E28_00639 [Methanocella sp. PtaU1.Bin125]|nr:MAG: hypothetical protein A4E28_00639 [Methanocella sp. PtaU1.Bin125]
MGDTGLDEEPDTQSGIRAITEVLIDRGAINYDSLLLARTCCRCGRLLFDADAMDIADRDTYRVVVRTPDARMYVLWGSEMMTARCSCSCFQAIVVYGPVLIGKDGYAAFTIIELNGLSRTMTCRLRDMRQLGDEPADVGRWIRDETAHSISEAARRTARNALEVVSDDWSGSRYSSGWISL